MPISPIVSPSSSEEEASAPVRTNVLRQNVLQQRRMSVLVTTQVSSIQSNFTDVKETSSEESFMGVRQEIPSSVIHTCSSETSSMCNTTTVTTTNQAIPAVPPQKIVPQNAPQNHRSYTRLAPKAKKTVTLPHIPDAPGASKHQPPTAPHTPTQKNLYRCMILSQNHKKMQEIKEHENIVIPPLLQFQELCAHLNVKPDKCSSPCAYLFSILDDSDNITTQLGYLITMDTWNSVELQDEFIVNLIGEFYTHRETHQVNVASNHPAETLYFVATRKLSNLIVVHPDILLSCTHIANSMYCERRPFFEVKFRRAIGKTDYRLFFGSMLHELYQQAMLKGRFSKEIYTDLLNVYLKEHHLYCHMNDLDQEQLRADAEDFYIKFEQWCVSWFPSSLENNLHDTNASRDAAPQTGSKHGPMLTPQDINVSLVELADIEESVWSPTYGLKGKIDLTWKAKHSGTEVAYPYEVKSGAFTPGYEKELSHCAQLALYILMLSDKHDSPFIMEGALFYLKDPFLKVVKINFQQVILLLVRRNELASRLVVSGNLPRMSRQKKTCEYCSSTHECMLYHKAIEGGTHETTKLPKEFFHRFTHLVQTNRDMQFIQKWLRLIDLEDAANNFVDREIWSLPASFKEYTHETCMSDLYVHKMEEKRSTMIYTLRRRSSMPNKDLNALDFSENDSVVVSTNDGRMVGLSRGTVLMISSHSIRLTCANKLPLGDVLLRVDRVSSGGYAASSRKNIMQLYVDEIGDPDMHAVESTHFNELSIDSMTKKNALVKQLLRNRIVNHSPPRFRPLTDDLKRDIEQCRHKLNPLQRYAVERILTAQDYVLVHGMPGTGKTSTISAAVDLLVSQHKKRILITAFTHTALDNILLKIIDSCHMDMRVYRYASSPQHVHPALHKHLLNSEYFLNNNIPSQSSYIIGCTAASAGSSLMLESIDFDYCIVDEAGQAITPVVLGPLRLARRFVLIGDPLQLPPLVVNEEAAEGGMKESLLAELCKAHPEAVCELSIQYRMNAHIMQLSNMLVYENKLKCGSLEVEKGRLSLPLLGQSKDHVYYQPKCPAWYRAALDVDLPIVFINTDDLGDCTENQTQDYAHARTKTQNPEEAHIVRILVQALVEGGLSVDDIGIISPLNSQVRLIHHEISQCLSHLRTMPMIKTIDKFQGTEKKCIIISMVRHNRDHLVSDIMLDVNRVNVALTRAQHKLILVGSVSTYQVHSPWTDIVNHFRASSAMFGVGIETSDEGQSRSKRKLSLREETHSLFQPYENDSDIWSSGIRSRRKRRKVGVTIDRSLYTSLLGIEHLPPQKQDRIINNQCKTGRKST